MVKRIAEKLGNGMASVLVWSFDQFRWGGGTGNLAIFRLFLSLIILSIVFIPLLIFGVLYNLWDKIRSIGT